MTILPKKIFFLIVLCTVFALPGFIYGQSVNNSYEKMWKIIHSDTITKENKLHYLDLYAQKARNEKNYYEEYRALEKKSFNIPFDQAVMLLHKMSPLVQALKNDSITGDFLNRSATLYYKNRHFKEALDYAVQSEKFSARTGHLYTLNATRIDIGNIYYHTKRYEKAKVYFEQARDYYKKNVDYNHLQGYISSLYSLSKCYWQLEDLAALQKTIAESEKMIPKLNPDYRILEEAYLNYLKGGYEFLRKNYDLSRTYFNNALPEIKDNDDVTNEYVIYLYLGKINWKQGKKQEAVTYFTKINDLFQERKFLNYELREAYNYLRTYYNETGQTDLQLQTTESLIALNQQFEKEQQYLTDVLHYQVESNQLQSDKIALNEQLNNIDKIPFGIWIALGGTLLLVTAVVFFKFRKKRIKTEFLQDSYSNEKDNLSDIQLVDENHTEDINKEFTNTDSQNISQHKEKDSSKSLSSTEKRLMKEFKLFEAKKEFKKTITLEQLAAQFGTNRTTLSNFLNTYKGGYNNYLSKLRIAAVVADLETNKNLRKKTLHEISVIYGFPNAKAFSSQFKTEMKKSPLDYIKQLEQKNDDLKNTIDN